MTKCEVNWRCRLALVVSLLLPLVRVIWYFASPGQLDLLGMMFHIAIDSILIGFAFAFYQGQIRRWLAANR